MKLDLLSSASRIALGAALAVATPVLLSGQAHAGAVTGSDGISFVGGVTPTNGANPSDLLTATSITITSPVNWGAGTGSFATAGVAGSSIISIPLTLGNLGTYSFTSSNVGNFNAASTITIGANVFTSQVVSKTGSLAGGSESLTVYLVGEFTPSGTGVLSGLTPNTASETLTFNETGSTSGGRLGSFSGSASLAAPASPPPPPPSPPGVPEPASMLLLGSGLVGLGAIRRRKR